MGLDLWIATVFITAIAMLAFLAGRQLSQTVYQTRSLLLAECLIFSLVFAFGLSNRLLWINVIPTPAVICWSNWMPVFLGLVTGLASKSHAMGRRTRPLIVGSLATVGVCFLLLPLSRPHLFPIETASVSAWEEGVCLQSHEASCGPAAVATLLYQADLSHSFGNQRLVPPEVIQQRLAHAEQHLAAACLTSDKGTSTLGLVRGLRLATAGTNQEVRVADTNPTRWITKQQLPNLAVVQFRDSPNTTNDRLGTVRRLMGSGGEAHAVVVVGRESSGLWKIGDPAVGWRYWTEEEFRQRFTGDAIYLSQR
ncbi:MAG: hypothetical protein AAFV88_13555 [Planctomycetota bacterium]